MLLSPHELALIRQKCEYKEEQDEWVVPPFYLKGKEVQLPKLGMGRGNQVVEQEKENRELAFDGDGKDYTEDLDDPYEYEAKEPTENYGDRIQSRGERKGIRKDEFRIQKSKKKKKRKAEKQREQNMDSQYGEEADFQNESSNNGSNYDPLYDGAENSGSEGFIHMRNQS